MAAPEARLLWNDDPFVPRAHKAILSAWAARNLPGWEIAWACETVPVPPAWEVKPWVARRLFAELWAAKEGNTLVVDAYVLPVSAAGWTVSDRKPELESASWGDYDEMRELVTSWGPAVPAMSVRDLRPFGARPWLNPFAQVTQAWRERVKEAIETRALTLEDLQLDFEEGLLKGPVFQALRTGREMARAEAVAAMESYPEITPPLEQRRALRGGGVRRRLNRYRRFASLSLDPSLRAQVRERLLLWRDELRLGLQSLGKEGGR